MSGPEHLRNYCPWWANAFWRAADLQGAVKIWELWDCEYYPGLGRIIAEMANALATAERAADAACPRP